MRANHLVDIYFVNFSEETRKFGGELTLKLAGYFATHIQARGGFVETPPQDF